MAPLTNVTITVPAGSTQYGDQLCTPPKWTDILIFYLSNYLVHVITVQTYPGESNISVVLAQVAAFLFPTSGIIRGLNRIVRLAVLEKDPLLRAARAGALCMVVRDPEFTCRIKPGERFEDAVCVEWPSRQITRPIEQLRKDSSAEPSLHGNVTSNAVACDATCIQAADKSSSESMSPIPPTGTGKKSLAQTHALTVKLEPLRPADGVLTAQVYWAPWQREGSNRWTYLDSAALVDLAESRKVAGSVVLPRGYMLAFVPRDAIVAPIDTLDANGRAVRLPDSTSTSSVAVAGSNGVRTSGDQIYASYSAFQGIAAVAQLLFGLSTIYTTAGPQVNRYGYAAFGLTVIPYAIMSLVNLLASVATPAYSATYVVDSVILQEAKSEGGIFSFVVGRLVPEANPAVFQEAPRKRGTDWPGGHQTVSSGTIVWETVQNSLQQSGTASTGPPPSCHTVQSGRDDSAETPIAPYFRNSEANATTDLVVGSHIPDSNLNDGLEMSSRVAERQLISILTSNPEVATFDALLQIPSHPQFQRKKRWYCRDGGNVVSQGANEQLKDWREPSRRERDGGAGIPFIASFLVGSASLLPIGLLSRFRKAQSTLTERVVTMMWLSFGIFIGWTEGNKGSTLDGFQRASGSAISKAWEDLSEAVSKASQMGKGRHRPSDTAPEDGVPDRVLTRTGLSYFLSFSLAVTYGAPAIAGLVEVGKMYSQFGNCVQIY